MGAHAMNTSILLATTAILFAATAAAAQQPRRPSAQRPPSAAGEYDELDEDEAGTIVVTGQRQRGTVIGDIPPENVLDSRDIRATGATSINELLDALAPQTGSGRGRGGGRPVVLVNGRRIRASRKCATFPPRRSRGSISFLRKLRSHTATAPISVW